MRRLVASALVLAALAGTAGSRAGLQRAAGGEAREHELLYLPNGEYLKAISLGNRGLLADLFYLWAIQYYSDYDRRDRYRFVEHVFGGVIAELDPRYVEPYWLGALILVVEARDLEGGLRLLDLGFARNPDEWILPYLAAFECYRVHDYVRAAHYMDEAARVKDAPPLVLRMKAGMFARAGEGREAIAMWHDVLGDPRSDEGIRAIASRQIRDLQVRLDLDDLRTAVARYRDVMGRLPRRLEDLVEAGMLRAVPLDPDGNPYRYDRESGTLSSSAGRVLGQS